jgi:hypothetical protein
MVDDPARDRWTSYRSTALGQSNKRLTLHAVYEPLGTTARGRQSADPALFPASLDPAAFDNIRVALNRNQPSGRRQFTPKIAELNAERGEARPRSRARKETRAPPVRQERLSAREL